MHEIKYYTPKISDLFDGYEFEYQEYDEIKDDYNDNWIETTFDSRCGLGHDLTHQFSEGTVRCKYLTKEQIKKEGWIYSHLQAPSEFGEYDTEEVFLRKGLNLHKDGKTIKIYQDGEAIFQGIVVSINEFRYIMKLLNI